MATSRPSLETQRKHYEAEGREAFRLRVKLEDNPYFGTRWAIHWRDGWKSEQQVAASEEVGGDELRDTDDDDGQA